MSRKNVENASKNNVETYIRHMLQPELPIERDLFDYMAQAPASSRAKTETTRKRRIGYIRRAHQRHVRTGPGGCCSTLIPIAATFVRPRGTNIVRLAAML